MSFSIIIPSRNATNLVACVKAVRAAGETASIIVVDDGVDWNQCDFDRVYPQFHIVSGQKPFVFARNCNIGIRAAGEDDVVLLNDDALLEGDRGFSILALASTDRDYGVIGATTNLTGQVLQQRRCNQGIVRQVPHIAFVCVYIPRRTLNTVGMLDERYCLDYGVEDRDYCEAVNRAGLKVGVSDWCYVDHGSLTSSFRGDPKAPRSFQQNLRLFREKWGITG